MKKGNELKFCLEAGYTLIGFAADDDASADKLLKTALADRLGDIWEYDNARGGVDFATKMPIGAADCALMSPDAEGDCVSMLAAFLDRVITDCRPIDCAMILRDVNEQMKDPRIVARIKAIDAENYTADRDGEKYRVQIIAVSSSVTFPAELARISTEVSMSPPDIGEITELVDGFIADGDLVCEDAVKTEICGALKGLTENGVRRVLSFVKAEYGKNADAGYVRAVHDEKARTVKNNGLLEMVDVSGFNCMVGGMENLMAYIDHVAIILGNRKAAAEFGVDMPKGILIAGMPGCGKSLAAKSAAKKFGIPLVRLDMGSLMGKYVGESERKLREALGVAEAVSPCVLWIDEMEKAFAGIGSGSDGGTTTRLFGHFLTWMNEKKSPVYVIATANDVTALPPELMRRGRFDNLFSVDLPSEKECRSILDIHMKRRGHSLPGAELDKLAKHASGSGYSGADIERLVQTGIEIAFRKRMSAKRNGDSDWDKVRLEAGDLRNALRLTHSIMEIMGPKIEALREKFESFRMDSASLGKEETT